MRTYSFWLALFVVLTTLLGFGPNSVQAQKKKASQAVHANEADYQWATQSKALAGTILAYDGSGSVSVRVTFTNLEPNPKYKPPVLNPKSRGYNPQAASNHRSYQNYRQMQQQYRNRRPTGRQTPQQMMQAQMRLYQQMMQMQRQLMQAQMRMAQQMASASAKAKSNPNNQPFIQVAHSKDFTLALQDKVIYRKMYLPFEFDDTGNPKKYTEAEKTALRGSDRTKPGYTATSDEIHVGATASFYLSAPEKNGPADLLGASNHPTVRMIVLTKEAPAY